MPVVYRAMYDFNAEEDGELDLKAGQMVQEHPSGQNQDGWTFVQNKDKKVGFVPTGYLELYREPSVKMLEALPVPPTPASTSTSTVVSSSTAVPTPTPPPTQMMMSAISPAAALNKTLQSPGDDDIGNLSTSISRFIGARSTATPGSNLTPDLTTSSAITKQLTTTTADSSKPSFRSAVSKVDAGLSLGKTHLNSSSTSRQIPSRSRYAPPAAEREDLSTLKSVSADNFSKILSMQKDNFEILSDMAQGLSDAVSSYAAVFMHSVIEYTI